MEGTSKIDHDRWMEKITQALRSFRMASLRKVEELRQRTRVAEDPGNDGGAKRDPTS